MRKSLIINSKFLSYCMWHTIYLYVAYNKVVCDIQ